VVAGLDMVSRVSGGPEILLHLDRGHPDTLAGQLRAALRDAIRTRRLLPGTRLPASRVLAQELGVSRGVVVDAYDQLVAEGFLMTRPGSGTVVSDAAGVTDEHLSWLHRREEAIPRLWRPEFDLRPVGPDPALFPRSQTAKAMTALFRHLPAGEFGYTGPWGVPRLRQQLAARLNRVRAAMASADGIVVVTGGTQAVTITARALAAAGHDRIAIEDPVSPSLRHLLQAHGLVPVPVPVDANGLDVAALDNTGCRVVMASPGYQFPTGALMSAARRTRLLEWAATRAALIVEDDRRAEFHLGRPALGCLQGMRPARVIMIGSVSLSLAPGMRIGWIVPPPDMLRAIAETKRDSDFGTGMCEQHALASLLEAGHYDHHVRHARRTYSARRAEMARQLAEHFPDWPQHDIGAGLEIMLELPGGLSEQHLIAHAKQMGLGLAGLSPMRAVPSGPPALILSYARLPARHCAEAVARLNRAVQAVLTEDRSLAAASIVAGRAGTWRLTSADWPAAVEDFYAW
jgi:GntR family transcriptional regulator / MocR family aminotransferase